MRAKGILAEDYELKSPQLLALSQIQKGSKVLSCGCGNGREVEYLINKLNCKVIAIDIDANAITKSRERNPNVQHFLTDMTYWISDEKFDYIICLWNTINYLIDLKSKQRFIKCCELNLKKNGKLIITSSNLGCGLFLRRLAHNIKYREMYYHFPNQVNKWFKGTNFYIYILRSKETEMIVGGLLHE